jgi:beta-lactamase superfamily II metal-dependent hydrolase
VKENLVMRRTAALALLCGLAGVAGLVAAQTTAGKTLDIYYIDTEGGQSTLFVSPTGESLLVDTGNAGGRDLERIIAAVNAAGVTQIDHMWTTHYHGDHVGAMEELATRVPIRHFYDHGPIAPNDRATPATFFAMYEALSKGRRTTVKPGDKVRMAGLDITTVSSNAVAIKTSLPGAGKPNPACAGVEKKDESAYFDPDNGSSAGFAMTFGKFTTVDLGDLTWNGELDIVCPVNRIGTIDLYLVSHHGIDRSSSPALVHGLQPRVAIMNNGTRKGGAANTFKVLESSPGLEDLWQLHWSHNVGVEHNAPGTFIANIEDNETIAGVLTAPPPAPRGAPGARGAAGAPGARGAGARGGPGGPGAAAAHTPAYWLKVSAQRDGAFTITNPRNGFSKTYRPED